MVLALNRKNPSNELKNNMENVEKNSVLSFEE